MRFFKNDNRGSGVVTVIVAIAFLTMLSLVVMFTAFTSFQMKTVERGGKANFYDAETAMNEIRAGIQQDVSDSLAMAYTDVLVDYNTFTDDEGNSAQNALSQNFVVELSNKGLYSITTIGANRSYSITSDSLLAYIKNADVSACTCSVGGISVSDNAITINDASIVYIENGYETRVVTDINIRTPRFSFADTSSTSGDSLGGLVTVAKAGIDSGAGNSVINGTAYGGKLDASTGSITLSNGSLVVAKNGVNVSSSVGKVVSLTGASLWTGNINIGTSSSVQLSGVTYNANDLNLAGASSSAVLSGQYYGFGTSSSDAAKSSAIIINGSHTKLNLTGLNKLMLAGRSFISIGTSANDVIMGESVSIKSNQLAYLIPPEYLGIVVTSNPYVCSIDYVPEDVPAAVNGVPVKIYSEALSGDPTHRIYYYFYDFSGDPQAAETHFKNYFSENSSVVTDYLKTYSSRLDSVSAIPYYGTAGGTLSSGESGAEFTSSRLSFSLSSTDIARQFTSLCQNLNPNFGDATVQDPYEHFVKNGLADSVSALELLPKAGSGNTYEFIDSNASSATYGKTVALICTDTSLTFNPEAYPYVKILLCSGDVRLTTSFTGLVICGGTLYLNGAVLTPASSADINTALASVNNNVRFDEFLTVSGSASSQTGGGGSVWDLSYLVTYANWSKN